MMSVAHLSAELLGAILKNSEKAAARGFHRIVPVAAGLLSPRPD
jgi:hypothetical protein